MVTQIDFENFSNNLTKQIEDIVTAVEDLVKKVDTDYDTSYDTPSPALLATLKAVFDGKKEPDLGSVSSSCGFEMNIDSPDDVDDRVTETKSTKATENLNSISNEDVDSIEAYPSNGEESELLRFSVHKFSVPDEGNVKSTFLDYQEGKPFISGNVYVDEENLKESNLLKTSEVNDSNLENLANFFSVRDYTDDWLKELFFLLHNKFRWWDSGSFWQGDNRSLFDRGKCEILQSISYEKLFLLVIPSLGYQQDFRFTNSLVQFCRNGLEFFLDRKLFDKMSARTIHFTFMLLFITEVEREWKLFSVRPDMVIQSLSGYVYSSPYSVHNFSVFDRGREVKLSVWDSEFGSEPYLGVQWWDGYLRKLVQEYHSHSLSPASIYSLLANGDSLGDAKKLNEVLPQDTSPSLLAHSAMFYETGKEGFALRFEYTRLLYDRGKGYEFVSMTEIVLKSVIVGNDGDSSQLMIKWSKKDGVASWGFLPVSTELSSQFWSPLDGVLLLYKKPDRLVEGSHLLMDAVVLYSPQITQYLLPCYSQLWSRDRSTFYTFRSLVILYLMLLLSSIANCY